MHACRFCKIGQFNRLINSVENVVLADRDRLGFHVNAPTIDTFGKINSWNGKPVHVHEFSGITSVDVGHRHEDVGTTEPAPSGVSFA